jgi:acyl-CoA thioesterase I
MTGRTHPSRLPCKTFRNVMHGAAVAIVFTLCSCGTPSQPISPPAASAELDTSIAINGVIFRNDTSIARSVASRGNNHRLWKFIEKARAGGTVRVGFLGGSITGGVMATDRRHYFSTLFCGYAGKLFPNATIEQINAGWGGTNSRFGASRQEDEVLANDPDLMFAEFAVNDDSRDTFTTTASMEGIVRRCLRNPDLPVILIFLMNQAGDTANQHLHSLIGNHYGLPLISYLDECRPLISSGAIPVDSIFFDSVHPNNRGHRLIAFLLSCFLANTVAENSPDQALPVPSPLVSDLYENAGIHKTGDTLVKVLSDTGWTIIAGDYGRFSYQSLQAGNVIEFASTAREITAGYQLSLHTSSRARITIDGSAPDTLSSYFVNGWEGGGMKLRRMYLDSAAAPHNIRFTSMDDDTFRIDFILYAP